MQFDFLSVFLLLGAAQGSFLSVLLLSKIVNRLANRLLAALMFFYSLSLVSLAFEFANGYVIYPHAIGTATALPFLFGPLHYLYSRYLQPEGDSFNLKDIWHFLPFVAYVIFLIPFFVESASVKLEFLALMQQGRTPKHLAVAGALKGIHGVTYMGLTLVLLMRLEQNGRSRREKLKWLWWITILTTIVWTVNAVLLLSGFAGFQIVGNVDMVVGIMIAVAVYTMGYLGLKQGALAPDGGSVWREGSKYERSGLSTDQADHLVGRITEMVEDSHIYRQPGLTLQQFGDQLGISTHHLSQLLNERMETTFFDLINSSRVDDAKRLLSDPNYDHLTLVAVAFEVGFNSKSAFNSAFKRYTHVTPSKFKKQKDKMS